MRDTGVQGERSDGARRGHTLGIATHAGRTPQRGDDDTSQVRSETAGRRGQRLGPRMRHRRGRRAARPQSATGAVDHRSINNVDSGTFGKSER